jgi:hypothetical protein
MPRITAIELENFQSIERRTRIELRPITLLFGPNSAGKSAVFDALELLRILLDPNEFDDDRASDMVNRWARRSPGDAKVREMSVAIEFKFEFESIWDIWSDPLNWQGHYPRTDTPGFWIDPDNDEFVDEEFMGRGREVFEGGVVRIDLNLKVEANRSGVECRLSECRCTFNDQPVVSITKSDPLDGNPEAAAYLDGSEDFGERILAVHNDFGLVSSSLMVQLHRLEAKDSSFIFRKTASSRCVTSGVVSRSLSPLNISVGPGMDRIPWGGIPQAIRQNGCDILFYLGTVLFRKSRGQAETVKSDRRTPMPAEALTVVDLGLSGWWSRDVFSASSPAALLRTISRGIDEHYQGLAEAAHADLLLRTGSADFWGDEHAAKHIEPVRARAQILERVNHHLEKSLFTEKLYRLFCASTLMVPIDLDEDDPWSYYALAQPAAVRLFLQDGDGNKVELQDVGSGIPFVLPILYAVACGKVVKIQQPELHLHPALQSSIADVFVEEFNCNPSTQFIIETHSEHLLLRLLRRIRDVEKGKCLSEDVRLTNGQLAVYYFDPQVSGGTVVTQQLVTPLGDFYTDWPRGFFSERNRDLFDD